MELAFITLAGFLGFILFLSFMCVALGRLLGLVKC